MRAAPQTVHIDKDIRLYGDFKWCVDVVKNIEQYMHRKRFTKGNQPIPHYNMREDIYAMVTMRRVSFEVTHVYGHNLVPLNKEADKLAKAGAQMSVVHKVSRRHRSWEEL